MRKKIYKGPIILLLLLVMLALLVPGETVGAAAKNDDGKSRKIKIGDFIELIVKTAGLPVDATREEPYLEAALSGGLVKEGEYTDRNIILTNTEAAILANRAEELLHGSKYDEALYDMIIEKNRISDLNKITKEKRSDVVKIYGKGIMIGSGNGKCSQSRRFGGREEVTVSEAKLIAERVKIPSKRRRLSPDGQLIRTNNLPRNAKDYEYILESFPNSFYEAKFEYQRGTYYYEPVELVDYASPARIKKSIFNEELKLTQEQVMKEHLDTWCNKVEENMKLRFNADYRTIDTAWISDLRNTYFIFGDAEADREKTNYIKGYVKEMKKDKVIVEAEKVVVEPSSLYYATGEHMRVYVKFRVLSGPVHEEAGFEKNKGVNLSQIFYDGPSYMEGFEKGKWIERYFDVSIGTKNMASNGSDYAVSSSGVSDAQRK